MRTIAARCGVGCTTGLRGFFAYPRWAVVLTIFFTFAGVGRLGEAPAFGHVTHADMEQSSGGAIPALPSGALPPRVPALSGFGTDQPAFAQTGAAAALPLVQTSSTTPADLPDLAKQRATEMESVLAAAPSAPGEPCDKSASPDGNDSASGSPADPYRTAVRLVQSLTAGQVGCLRVPAGKDPLYAADISMTVSGPSLDDRTTLQTDPTDAAQGRFAVLKGHLVVSGSNILISKLVLDGRNAGRLASPEITGNEVIFADDNVTNDSTVDCFRIYRPTGQTSTPYRPFIIRNRIHHCRNAVQFENTQLGGVQLSVIYANQRAGVRFGPDAHYATVYRTILDTNVDNSVWAGSATNSNVVQYSIVSFPWRWNVTVDSADPVAPSGSLNSAYFNCAWSTAGLYAAPHGISSDAQARFYANSGPNTVSDPAYVDRPGKNFTILPTSPCFDYTQNNRGTIGAHTDIYTDLVAGGGPTATDIQPTRVATHETGDRSEYDEVRNGTHDPFSVTSQDIAAYRGSWKAKHAYDGDPAGGRLGGGAFRINAPDGYEGYYGAAFYVPSGTFTGATPALTGRVNIMSWDNYDSIGDAGNYDYGGIGLYQGKAFLFRAHLHDTTTPFLGESFRIGEGCWNYISVHQRFSGQQGDPQNPLGGGSYSEVFLNGTSVAKSSNPNAYGRAINHVRFGLPWISQTSNVPLTVYVDDAYVSSYENIAPGSNVCTSPDTTITTGPAGNGVGSGAGFEFSSTQAGSTFECSLDGAAWSTCASPSHFTGLRDGPHTLRVRAIGPANTPDLSPSTWNWTADGEANANSAHPAVAGDGSYIAFESDATNLIDGDTNGQKDVFVENQTSQTFKRISVNATGDQADGPSYSPSVSDDGRLIAFQSDATNLVPGDTNRVSDVFVYDQADRSIRRVSVTDTGAEIGPCPPQPQACSSSLLAAGSVPSISGNGKYITFVSQQGPVVAGGPSSSARQVYVYDRLTQRTVDWVSVGLSGQAASGRTPAISADGGYVAFSSVATNLVNGDTNGVSDVFLRDRTAHTTSRISVSSGGAQANGASANPAISDDGRYVAFDSTASNLVVTDVTGAPDTDTNGVSDVFRYDQIGAITIRVSKKAASSPEPNGGSYLPQIAGDGQHVAFESDASNNTQYNTDGNGARDIFTWEASPLAVKPHSVRFETNVPTGNGPSSGASITNDGAFVSYKSDASDLSPAGDTHTTDVLVHEVGPCINTFADRVDRLYLICHMEADGYANQAGIAARDDCIAMNGTTEQCREAYWDAYEKEYPKRFDACIFRLFRYS